MTSFSAPVDGFRLAYDDHVPPAAPDAADAPVVVLLHGWPGDRTDHRRLVPLLRDHARLVVPDLRGFGESDRHDRPPEEYYSAAAQARSLLGLLDELGVGSATFVGYDVGSRVAQAIARDTPDRVDRLVLAPPLPGAGDRLLAPEPQQEFWYQQFHQLTVAEELVDGRPDAVRAYLRHIWSHWSGPGPDGTDSPADLDHLVDVYGQPGAFTASIRWYRAGSGSVAQARHDTPPATRYAVPLHAVWPHHDPLFPVAWADRLGEWFEHVTLTEAPDSGHFVPLEAPELLAAAVVERS